ncbi:MAG TPA: efflux RND transporter periplasmic adaptor subunit [Bryobacteraceae bacterium]|jgi:membrane fusion protein (multidrug efflux system)|nr:efflux RND transporter periplasmic adaptor subunit [Bryobacteraceae bacterium]
MKANATQAFPPPLVSFVDVHPQDVPIYAEYAAQTYARDMVDVRGRVEGFIEQRLFQVGSDVKAGQVLYVLDRRPYQASVAKAKGDLENAQASLEFARRQVALVQAQADLVQARANLAKAQQDVDRLRPLVKEDAAAQQDLDNALSALDANKANVAAKVASVEQARLSTKAQIDTTQAQVEANKALLQTAQLNLEYATIQAPISGRVGDTLIPVGGLVTPTAAQPLTTIVPLDPIWVRFKVSEGEYLAFQQRQDKAAQLQQPLELILANNQPHPYAGKIANSVNQVDPKTGTLELQATFPNPQHDLLPGQFGRVRLRTAERKGVILVPQKAVQELQGLQSVLTVGDGNKVLARSIVTGDRVGERWVVEQGLKPGDKVIVEGMQKARPGSVVNPQPYVERSTKPVPSK